MSEEVIKKVKELYDSVMYLPNKVFAIFSDYFGEERVDMQGFCSYNNFLDLLNGNALSWFFPNKKAVLQCDEFVNSSKEAKDIIVTLLDNDVLDVPVTSDNIVATYFLPIMSSAILSKLTHGFILVHFPHVRVTNEYDRFVDINHLWVKVGLNINGTSVGYFGVNRSEYKSSHMKADYMHSHVAGIPFDDFKVFKSPCLGSGPIKTTVATLTVEYDESIWQLFCLELDRYIRIESIAGVPHRRLENINSANNMILGETTFNMNLTSYYYTEQFSREHMRDFVKFLIRGKKLKFNFVNGSYGFAMSYLDYRILISNEFIRWFNRKFSIGAICTTFRQLKTIGLLRRCVIDNGKIKYFRGNTNFCDYHLYEGAFVCEFKGSPVTIHVVDEELNDDNTTILICPELAEAVARAILKVINYKYGREERREDIGVSTPTTYL